MADKYAAFGAKLQYETAVPTVFADIAGIRDMSGPGVSGDVVDVTTHDSPSAFREFLKTVIDPGEVSFDIVYDPEDAAGQGALEDESVARTFKTYRVVYNTTGAKTWEFNACVTQLEPNQPVEGEISASVSLKLSGVIDKSPA
jgi:predicted secreted protein